MASSGWQFWEVTDDGGELRWLGATRPTGRTAANRATVWTLIPSTRIFIANWFVSEAWSTEDSGLCFEDINSTYAQRIALDVPQPTKEDLARITHRSACSRCPMSRPTPWSKCWASVSTRSCKSDVEQRDFMLSAGTERVKSCPGHGHRRRSRRGEHPGVCKAMAAVPPSRVLKCVEGREPRSSSSQSRRPGSLWSPVSRPAI